jgi:tetratricopeptide (TPR) repeat protein
LGEILTRRRNFDQAEVHCRAAVTIAIQQMGKDYLDLPKLLSALAGVLSEQGKLVEARQYAEQAVDICRRHPNEVGRSQQDEAAAALNNVLTKLRDHVTDKKN